MLIQLIYILKYEKICDRDLRNTPGIHLKVAAKEFNTLKARKCKRSIKQWIRAKI